MEALKIYYTCVVYFLTISDHVGPYPSLRACYYMCIHCYMLCYQYVCLTIIPVYNYSFRSYKATYCWGTSSIL